MKRITLILALGLFFAANVFAHNGALTFMPTVPDPTAMTMDGTEDDWEWYDRTFAVTPEEIGSWFGEHVEQGGNPNPTDWSGSYFLAWSPPPDNRFWFFARVFDDTLRAAEGENKGAWWNDDVVQLSIDGDHSGGGYLANEVAEDINNGYRIQQHPLFSDEFGVDIGGGALPPEGEWGGDPEWIDFGGTILPADADHLSTNLEYTYEMALTMFDFYDIFGPEDSVIHTFEPDQVIGLTVRFCDGDRGENGEQDGWGLLTGNYLGDRDGDQSGDAQALLTIESLDGYQDGKATAVESVTWGRIKSNIK